MNILIIPTWYSSYDEKIMTAGIFHYEQAIALKKHSNVALFFPFDKCLNTDFKCSIENNLITYRSKLYKNIFKRYFKWFIHFYKINKEFKPDIIHAQVASSAGFLAILFKIVYHVPVIITEHNPIELMQIDNKKNYFKNYLSYKFSNKNVCVSKSCKDKLQNYFPKFKFSVIYNGIINPNTIEFDDIQYRFTNCINCCIVAAFYNKEVKGFQYLLPAIKNIINNGYKIKLHVCGGGEYLDYYINMAKSLNIYDNCIFYNQCKKEKVYSIISQMDFCISSSLFESAGVFVQESMLLGKPLVVTKSGGPDSLVNKDTAIIVDKGNVQSLTNGIEQMIGLYNSYNTEVIKSYAYENFEIDNVTKQYINLYKKVLDRRNKYE